MAAGFDKLKQLIRKTPQVPNEEVEQPQEKLKLLLLGCGQVGKSTLYKQCCQLFGRELDRKTFASSIQSNVISGMQALLDKAKLLNPLWDENLLASQVIVEKLDSVCPLKVEEAQHLKYLWQDAKLQEAWLLQDTFQVSNNLEHFMNEVDDIAALDYHPSLLDVMHAETRTTGIIESDVTIQGRQVTLVDVGGQRNERKKWIHCFDQISCVVFVVNLNGYNRVLFEDEEQNRLLEDLACFEQIVNLANFKDTPFCLIFNFRDLFKVKIESSWDGQARELSRHLPTDLLGIVQGYITCMSAQLSQLFPDYQGGADYERGLAYIREKFLRLDRRVSNKPMCFATCMLDTPEVKDCMNQLITTLNKRP